MTPDQAESIYRQGLIAAQAGRWTEAREAIAQAITARPGVPVWWATYGLVLESQGDLPGAVQAFAGALNLDGDLAMAMDGLLAAAETLTDAGRTDLAEGCYCRALALTPDTPAALAKASVLLRAQGLDPSKLLRRAAVLRPDRYA
ncbi:tetratricopeptide repeat protein [Azospirillum sp. YIM B02556]|uniref:Tetratricopeptide repeat protein n=1 Tax=Azospirillum endophyticum TaxID=2800326 RepID=A0ABS1F398_9PROT|nr:tetratricopeptide repeat protein [Azospirillum endophyticum]MBK1837909.1 tetratricopeptide repeat protein [Azospirillum endophyticum]